MGDASRFGGCGEVRPGLGVYLLGAVESADRRLIDAHLAGCVQCRRELAELAGLPALLGRVTAEEAAGVTADGARDGRADRWPSGELLRSQLARAARIRRYRLRAWVSAAALAGALAGSAIVVAVHFAQPAKHQPAARPPVARAQSGSPPPRPDWVLTARVTNPRTRVSAIVRYVPEVWGLKLGVRVWGAQAGATCQLEVIDSAGHATTADGWTIAGRGGVWYPGSVSLPLSSVARFVVVAGHRALVTIPLRPERRSHRQARLLPHDRRSAPAFGVPGSPSRPQAVGLDGDAESYGITTRTRPRQRVGGASWRAAALVPGGALSRCGCLPQPHREHRA